MRARLLALAMLLGVLVALPAGVASARTASVNLTVSDHSIVFGRSVVFRVRTHGVPDGAFAEIRRLTPKGWVTAYATRIDHHRTRARLSPTFLGANRYRLVTRDAAGKIVRSRVVVVHAAGRPDLTLSSSVARLTGGRFAVTAYVTLGPGVPAPRAALQQRIAGAWRTLSTRRRPTGGAQQWGTSFSVLVDEPGPLRVLGWGPGWQAARSLTDVPTAAGALAVDGPSVTLPASSGVAPRRLVFQGHAGDLIAVLGDDYGPSMHLSRSGGPEVDLVSGRATLATDGTYRLDVDGSPQTQTVRVVRLTTTTTTVAGPTISTPTVADPRAPRLVRFTADAGDFIDVRATSPTTHGRQCSSDQWNPGLSQTGPRLAPVITTSSGTTAYVVEQPGTYTVALNCSSTKAVDVDIDRIPIFDAPTNGDPVPFSSELGRLTAFRFITSTSPATTALTRQSAGQLWPTWVQSLWSLTEPSYSVVRGTDDVTTYVSGAHLLLVQARQDEPSASVSLHDVPPN